MEERGKSLFEQLNLDGLFVQALILIALGYALGMKAPLAGIVLGTLLTLLIGGACAAASNALALTTKSEDVMAPVINMVMMPVLLLSGILLPMTIGLAWLEKASDLMPIRHVVDAVRNSFGGDFSSSGLLWGSLWSLALFALAVWWGTATFRKENA
ncbi:MAG: ABC transporter permease [Nocardioidaceae bacterium]